jgi:hypothetical protein
MIRFALLSVLAGLGAFLVIGCWEPASDPISFSQFVGSYRANFGSAQLDEVEFRRDSIYVHRYQESGGPLETDSGRYEFQIDSERCEYRVSVDRFLLFGDNLMCITFQHTTSDGRRYLFAELVVQRFGNKQLVELCPDQYLGYVKFK